MQTHPSLSISPAALADALLPAVLAAARVQMRYFRSGASVSIKADRSPVTVADQESEAILTAALKGVAPGVPIVAEEAVAAGDLPATDIDRGAFFLVDPLDGTREFIADRDEFTINIALIRDRSPCFGIIYAPALGHLYATVGETAVIEAVISPTAPVTRMADAGGHAIQSRIPDRDGLVAVASRSHNTPGTDMFLGQFRIKERRHAGSSLKFCLLANGEADLYPRVGQTSEWDTAAGHAILAAAGGRVTKLDGSPLLYGKSSERFQNPDFVAWGRQPVAPQF